MATGADWRAGGAEREIVAGQLREHYAAGRLTFEEFRARLDAAYSVPTARELALVTADLPGAGPPWPASSPGAPGPDRTRRPSRLSRARRWRRRGLAAVLVLAGLVTGGVLVANSLPHGGLILLALLLVALPLALLTALAATVVWVGRRAWRSGAWLEVVPAAAGAPWLGRVVWLARAALVGRAFWRLGSRARRPGRSRRVYVPYQDYPGAPPPGGTWRHARAGGLSGTTR